MVLPCVGVGIADTDGVAAAEVCMGTAASLVSLLESSETAFLVAGVDVLDAGFVD